MTHILAGGVGEKRQREENQSQETIDDRLSVMMGWVPLIFVGVSGCCREVKGGMMAGRFDGWWRRVLAWERISH